MLKRGGNNYYIDWDNRLMLESHLLPELINYQKDYPDLVYSRIIRRMLFMTA
ncbi:MAG: hypothetical protein LBH06_07100 [Rikenellaceae bacterium]|nr:hypothetical protein [Rikenellaceae bacterium]